MGRPQKWRMVCDRQVTVAGGHHLVLSLTVPRSGWSGASDVSSMRFACATHVSVGLACGPDASPASGTPCAWHQNEKNTRAHGPARSHRPRAHRQQA